MSQNVGPAGIGVCGAFMSPWRGAEGESLAAVPSSCYSIAVCGYARAVSSLILGNAAFSLLGRSEEWT